MKKQDSRTNALATRADCPPPAMLQQVPTDLNFTRRPAEVIAQAREASIQLKKVVEQAKLVVRIGPSEHLQFEAWQTLGQFYGVTAKVEGTTRLAEDGTFYGYEASALVLRNSEVISRAEAMCCVDEDNWKKKPRFQLRSMAQTRACAKALRNVLAWIVVLAGYKATPAEEMIPNRETVVVQPTRLDELQAEIKALWKKLIKVSGKTREELKEDCAEKNIASLKSRSEDEASKILEVLQEMFERLAQ